MASEAVGLGSRISPARYFSIGSDLRIRRLGEDEPEGWVGARRVREEPTETLLAVNLETLIGLPLAWVRFSGPIDPSVDMVATDPLGRVHLLELKKASVGVQEASQLEQYLLSHVFDDRGRFLADSFERHGKQQSEVAALTRRLVGLAANQRMVSFGAKNLVRILGPDDSAAQSAEGGRLNALQWKRLGYDEQTRRMHEALAVKAAQEGLKYYPDLGWAERLARRLSAPLRAKATQVSQVGAVQPAVVLWLVGRAIQDSALERIRMWRRAGVDARPLRLEVRRADPGWLVRVCREQADERDKLEHKLLRADTLSRLAETSVRLHLYEEKPPSSPRQLGGRPLLDPKAVAVWPDDTRETITA